MCRSRCVSGTANPDGAVGTGPPRHPLGAGTSRRPAVGTYFAQLALAIRSLRGGARLRADDVGQRVGPAGEPLRNERCLTYREARPWLKRSNVAIGVLPGRTEVRWLGSDERDGYRRPHSTALTRNMLHRPHVAVRRTAQGTHIKAGRSASSSERRALDTEGGGQLASWSDSGRLALRSPDQVGRWRTTSTAPATSRASSSGPPRISTRPAPMFAPMTPAVMIRYDRPVNAPAPMRHTRVRRKPGLLRAVTAAGRRTSSPMAPATA